MSEEKQAEPGGEPEIKKESSIKQRFRTYGFWRDAIVIGLLVIIAISLTSMLMPAPYNPRYLFNLAFREPTAVCRDGVYSFSSSRSGVCSNHGGVQNWLPKQR